MSSPWAKIEKPEPVSLEEIMSEEVARDLQKKEQQLVINISEKHQQKVSNDEIASGSSSKCEEISQEILQALEDSDTCESDAVIAKTLQLQFDKEHDEELKRNESKLNGSSKVSVSFENYRRTPKNLDESESEEEIEDIIDRKDWDRFDTLEREFGDMPPCGYKISDGKMITKHDAVMSSRKNACKLLSFPPEFHTGDGENFDLKLSNKVFNSLKIYSQHEQARRHRMNDKKEDQATAEFGLDKFTRLQLYKMVNVGLLEQVNGVISIGKEAVVLHADGCPDYDKIPDVPKECVIKVFKTTLSEFKQRDRYIKDDYRFKDRVGKQTARRTVHLWAEKEMANLYRLQKAGVACPRVVTLKTHVLVMSFIGENHRAAQKLKDVRLSAAEYIIAYDQVTNAMKSMFNEANLVHADLSEYNILWHNDQCYIIDVSQAVQSITLDSFHLLMRDCNNITNFFEKKMVPNVMSPDELFLFVTNGISFADRISWEKNIATVKERIKLKPHLVHRSDIELNDNFDEVWESIKNTSDKILGQEGALVELPTA